MGGTREMRAVRRWENQKEGDRLAGQGIDGRLMIKW